MESEDKFRREKIREMKKEKISSRENRWIKIQLEIRKERENNREEERKKKRRERKK